MVTTLAAQRPNRVKRVSGIVTLTPNVLEISDAGQTIAIGVDFFRNCFVLYGITWYCMQVGPLRQVKTSLTNIFTNIKIRLVKNEIRQFNPK